MKNKYEDNARVFNAVCDSNRLIIIETLQSGEKCACTILAELSIVHSTLSYHMKILCESGIVSCRHEGKRIYYSIDKEGCEIAKKLLDEITTTSFK